MVRSYRTAIVGCSAALIIAICMATTTLAQGFPLKNESGLTDNADILTPDQESQIEAVLKELKVQRGIDFHLVTISYVGNYVKDVSTDDYAKLLFKQWEIGTEDRNDGVLLLIAQQDRELRIQLGDSYGSKKNIPMQVIIDHHITPNFKIGNFAVGIQSGVNQIAAEVSGIWPGEYDKPAIVRILNSLERKLGNFLYLVFTPLGFFAVPYIRRYYRNRPRKCPNDGQRMVRLIEEVEDDHLDIGQIAEENIDSISYDIWKCKTCAHIKVEGCRNARSRFMACTSCGYHTLEGERISYLAASTHATGQATYKYNCKNCKNTYKVDRVLPVTPQVSTYDGNSRSSFGGGGRSGGGGASGSW